MRRSILVALAALAIVTTTYAQEDDRVAQIRKDYNEVKAQIAKLPKRG